jgi:MoxR-like ATPase
MLLEQAPVEVFDAGHATRFAELFRALTSNITSVIRGKDDAVRLVLQCLLSGGHALLEDNPGTAKTTLAKAISRSIDGSFSRLQFTPDLLPSDVTGVQIYEPDRKVFTYREGPVFANIVLADEINRASPKTQSALLEAMAEGQITIDGEAHIMPSPFLVIATQNTVEMHGTYPLPEAQLDRFTIRTSIGYPDHKTEVQIVRDTLARLSTDSLQPVLTARDAHAMAIAVSGVFVADALIDYLVAIGARTRTQPELRLGASTRGIAQLTRMSQARAASEGRHYVTVDDVKVLVEPVLAHRLVLRPEAAIQGLTAGSVLAEIAAAVPVPRQRL